MEIREAKRIIKLRQWGEMIRACQTSGLNVREWCQANAISPSTYYNHLREVRQEMLSGGGADMEALSAQPKGFPVFFELALPGNGLTDAESLEATDVPLSAGTITPCRTTAATITVGRMTIDIHNDAGPETISYVVKAASEAAEGGVSG